MIKRKKGFTLTELIIVIAIIGVLAAVMIPTLGGYIEKARYSADVQEVKNMNTLIQLETEDYTTNLPYSAPALRYLLENAGYKGNYTTKSKGTYLWYDTESHLIVLGKLGDMVSGDPEMTGLSFSPFNLPVVSAADKKYVFNKLIDNPENILATEAGDPVILLGGNKNDNLVSVVVKIRNLGSTPGASIDNDLSKINNVHIKDKLTDIVDNSLFVSSSGNFAKGQVIRNVIFTEEKALVVRDSSFPEDLNYENLNTIILPPNVIQIEEGAFTKLISEEKIVKVVLENKKIDVSNIEIADKLAIVFGNDGKHYDAKNNPYNWIIEFNETTILKELGIINDALQPLARLDVDEVPDENGYFRVQIVVLEQDAVLIAEETMEPIMVGIAGALGSLAGGGVQSAAVKQGDIEYSIEDFTDQMNVALPVLLCFLGIEADLENGIDLGDLVGSITEKFPEIKIQDITLGFLVDNTERIYITGHVKTTKPVKEYNVYYSFEFVYGEQVLEN